MDHQKAQAARLRGWKTTIIKNKTAIPDINRWIAKLIANTPAQLIQISPQMTMTTDAAPSGWDSTLEKEQEMIAMAHGTWNQRQAKLSSNNREIKAITQGLRNRVGEVIISSFLFQLLRLLDSIPILGILLHVLQVFLVLMEEKDIVDVIDYSDLGFHSYLLHYWFHCCCKVYCGCFGTRMLGMVVILLGLLDGEMR
ncbi:MAG: hypothetical protein EZS28_052443, partial [Streblomastix strix]